jgi:hypothetical protein
MMMIHQKCFVVCSKKKKKSQITDHFLVIGCNEPYTSYDSIFGGHLLDVITCKKCGKVNINCIEKIYLIIYLSL